jgi:hypothetical protein
MSNQKQTLNVLGDPIPYADLIKMHGNYQDKQDLLSTHIGQAETQCIWFELNQSFKNFLADLLNPANQVSGLRVYLCQYDKDTLPKNLPEEKKRFYLNKLTVGFVATQAGPSGDPNDHPDHPDAVNKNQFMIDPYNQGKICPPDVCP